MRLATFALIGALLAGCSAEPTREAGEADYAAINAAARGPAIAVQLDAFEGDALAAQRIEGASCTLSRLNDPGPIVIATPEVAHAIIDGELQTFAAYPGKRTLAFEVAQHFDGRAYTLEIAPTEPGVPLGSAQGGADAMVLLRDADERLVHEGFGTLECAGEPPPPSRSAAL